MHKRADKTLFVEKIEIGLQKIIRINKKQNEPYTDLKKRYKKYTYVQQIFYAPHLGDDSTHLGGVHAQDGTLRGVDDGRAEKRAEHAPVGDGEGTTRHILQGHGTLLGLLAEVADRLLHILN